MDSSIGMNSGQDVSSSAQSMVPSSEPTSSSSDVTNEKTFTQNDVNEIVKRAKNEAVERDRRLRVEQPDYAQKKYEGSFQQDQSSSAQSFQNNQSRNNFNDDQIRQIVAEESKRQREAFEKETLQKQQQEHAQSIVSKFLSKIEAGKTNYQDFDSVTGDIEFARFPNTVQLLAENVDNVADVLYDLGKNRFKMAQIESLSYLSPNDAVKEIQRLASSIKENQEASKVRLPNEPLSQLRPSTTGTDNGNTRSVADFKRMFRV